jgi:hypothetical protein
MREHFYTYPTVVELRPGSVGAFSARALERPSAPAQSVQVQPRPQMPAAGSQQR